MPKIIPKPLNYDMTDTIPCPNCGDELSIPNTFLDSHHWECSRCGLAVPRMATADGRRILEVYTGASECTKRAIRRLFSWVNFGQEID